MGFYNLFNFMKLYSLLFEAKLDVSSLAVFKSRSDEGGVFVLYDTVELVRQFPAPSDEAFMKAVVGAVTVRPPDEFSGDCAGAWNVAWSVRNPAYPGAGKLTIQLASSMLKAPVTSDRDSSSSPDAKAMWDRVAGDSGFQRVPLDNFRQKNPAKPSDGNIYVDVADDGDGLLVTDRDGPRTPPWFDDCVVPNVDKLGAGDAFKAKLDAGPFTSRHKATMHLLFKNHDADIREVEESLVAAGGAWFDKLY